METPGLPSSRKPHGISRDKNKSERRKRDLSCRRWGECPREPNSTLTINPQPNMAQPIPLQMPARDPRAELQIRLRNAPLQHAEALLSGYELLQRLHDRGVLDLLRGALGSSDKVIEIVVDAAKTPEAIIAARNLLILSKVVFTLEPELLEDIAKTVPNSLTQAREEKPLSLWQMFKKMCSHDTRRALSTMLNVLESFGKSLGSVRS